MICEITLFYMISRDFWLMNPPICCGAKANPGYGLSFWLHTNVGNKSLKVIAAAGHGRQRLYMLPELELVVVRQGEGRYGQERFEDDIFLRALLAD